MCGKGGSHVIRLSRAVVRLARRAGRNVQRACLRSVKERSARVDQAWNPLRADDAIPRPSAPADGTTTGEPPCTR